MSKPQPQMSHQQSSRLFLGPILGTTVVFALALLAWWRTGEWYQAHLLAEQRTRVERRLIPYGNALTTIINQHFAHLEGLAAFVSTHPTAADLDESFESFAAGLFISKASDVRQ